LWQLSQNEVWAAVKKLADKLSESRGSPGSITVSTWLLKHGKTREEVYSIALAGVWRAAKEFDPAKGTFQTYAYYHILGAIRHDLLRDSQPDEGIAVPYAPDAHDVPDYEASPDTLVRTVDLYSRIIGVPKGSLVRQIYRESGSLPSGYLDDVIACIDLHLLEQSREVQALEIARSMLIAQSIRAADREGRMVRVSDLAQMLRARKHPNPRNEKVPSYAQLQREFGISDKTIKEWLRASKDEGIAADDLSPETLDRLSRIMTPRRGPRAGQKQIPSSD